MEIWVIHGSTTLLFLLLLTILAKQSELINSKLSNSAIAHCIRNYSS